MSCACCASLKCFESCYEQFNAMKQSKQILQETDNILNVIQKGQISSYFSLNKYIASKSFNCNEQPFRYFIQLIINYVFYTHNIIKCIDDKLDPTKISKESIIDILSILRFESIDSSFFYHYIFIKESQKNLIKEDKIIYLLKIFDLNTLQSIFSIPSFSFIQSNYLSNCEFVNFFKSIVSASITNDFTSIYQLIFKYLEDQSEKGELTQSQFIEFIKQKFSIEENFLNQKINIECFTNTLQKIIQFILLPSSQNASTNTQKPLDLDEFSKIFDISCKFMRSSIKYEIFDIAYKRKDLYFSGKVNNHDASDILDEISIIYTKLNKDKITKQITQLEISYFDFLSMIEEEIDLTDLQ